MLRRGSAREAARLLGLSAARSRVRLPLRTYSPESPVADALFHFQESDERLEIAGVWLDHGTGSGVAKEALAYSMSAPPAPASCMHQGWLEIAKRAADIDTDPSPETWFVLLAEHDFEAERGLFRLRMHLGGNAGARQVHLALCASQID